MIIETENAVIKIYDDCAYVKYRRCEGEIKDCIDINLNYYVLCETIQKDGCLVVIHEFNDYMYYVDIKCNDVRYHGHIYGPGVV